MLNINHINIIVLARKKAFRHLFMSKPHSGFIECIIRISGQTTIEQWGPFDAFISSLAVSLKNYKIIVSAFGTEKTFRASLGNGVFKNVAKV